MLIIVSMPATRGGISYLNAASQQWNCAELFAACKRCSKVGLLACELFTKEVADGLEHPCLCRCHIDIPPADSAAF